ncbi:MAG: fibronectin type III domain-containing protein [Verrucomicrobia bacterium]|nr:fibronectin type III domain-containing protein [Verrucomicrobiota bacterium]
MNFGLPLEDVTQYHLVDVSSDASAWCFRHNGIIRRVLSPNSPSFTSDSDLGWSGGGYFDGEIAELLIYTRALSTAERESVVRYFNDKYQFLETPPVPQSIQSFPVSTNQVSLWWGSGTWSGQSQLKTRVERKVSGGAFSEVAVVTGTSFIDQGLSANTTYVYRLRASADGVVDSAYSAECPVTTAVAGPGIPFGSLRIWLKADTGVVRLGDNRVPQWFDQSGNGNHAWHDLIATSPGAPLVDPTGWSGRPVIDFPGDRAFNLPSLSDLGQAEAFIVVKADSATSAPHGWGIWTMGGTPSGYPWIDGGILDYFGSSCAHALTVPVDVMVAYHLYSVSSSTSQWKAWINEMELIPTQNPCPGPFSAAPKLGSGNNPFRGDIVEFMLFSSTLSATEENNEHQTVSRYFRARYGLW